MSNQSTNKSTGILTKIKSSSFLKQLLFIFVLILLILLLVSFGLSIYTNHGQKLTLPKFIGMDITEANAKADDMSFNIVINDSVFIVGKPGGIITDQNPKPESLVKENRKIYVTITKFGTETIKVKDLPTLYGNAFDQKKTELSYRDIACVIKDYAYDPGEPNHILEVYYKGKLIISKDIREDNVEIAKGDQLDFVLSRRDGGEVTIPNLKCLTLDEAKFLIENNKLSIGDIISKTDSNTDGLVFVISQSPIYDGISNIKMGEKINITVNGTRPVECQ